MSFHDPPCEPDIVFFKVQVVLPLLFASVLEMDLVGGGKSVRLVKIQLLEVLTRL